MRSGTDRRAGASRHARGRPFPLSVALREGAARSTRAPRSFSTGAWTTRYLGDLSGGRIIKRMMQRHYGLTQGGIAFYDFPQIHQLKPFKDVYRERLDALPFDEPQRTAVVKEASAAFLLNQAVFGQLGELHAFD